MPEDSDLSSRDLGPALVEVLKSAARLQQSVPDAVLVGGSAAALYAGHRESMDHDHVLADLKERFDVVLEAVEATEGWVTNRVVPGKLILGSLGDIEAGVRQMRRKTPLETTLLQLPTGERIAVPTWEETLRVKAYLVVRRNQTRDFLAVAALADMGGLDNAAATLAGIDRYYADQHDSKDGVASQLARQLSDPRPADSLVTRELARYKGLKPRWHDWRETVRICQELADRILAFNDAEVSMTLKFRNLDVSPGSPVREWPTEAVLTALERGSLHDWRRLLRAIEEDPWGEVARKAEQALLVSRPYGVAGLMERAIERARACAASEERGEIASQVRQHLQASGLTQAEFAARIGTSASRLSTYLSGKVTPSAALLLRMQRVNRRQ